ncbi:hypothetical protein N9N28_04250 [Rubripirellula amarantea]|nr:hypothetical protein [Rubripirellula amarantea]
MIKSLCLAATVAVTGAFASTSSEAMAGDCYSRGHGHNRSHHGSYYGSRYRSPVAPYRSPVVRYSSGYRGGYVPSPYRSYGYGSPSFGSRYGGFGYSGFGYGRGTSIGVGRRGVSIGIGF